VTRVIWRTSFAESALHTRLRRNVREMSSCDAPKTALHRQPLKYAARLPLCAEVADENAERQPDRLG
jgi:hypothetical protein